MNQLNSNGGRPTSTTTNGANSNGQQFGNAISSSSLNPIHNQITQEVKSILTDKKELKVSLALPNPSKKIEDSVVLDAKLKHKYPQALKSLIQDSMRVVKLSGTLPNLNLAWFLIDDSVHLWNYEYDIYNVIEADKQGVTTVGFIKARPGVFPSEIEYLLVFGFERSIKAFGLTLSLLNESDQFKSFDIDLNYDCGFTPSFIIGAENGRVFIGSNLGAVSELVYGNKDSFFSSKHRVVTCSESYIWFLPQLFSSQSEEKQIISMSIDEKRHILYSLSKDSQIKVIDLGIKGESFSFLEKVPDFRAEASRTMGFADNARISLASIHAIPQSDSSELRLVAVAVSGALLYYTSSEKHFMTSATGLKYFTARPPRTDLALESAIYSSKSYYNNGVLITSSPLPDSEFSLVFNYIEKFPNLNKNGPIEVYNVSKIPGSVFGIYEAPSNPQKSYVSAELSAHITSFDDLKAQYFSPSRRFNILTSKGLEIIEKQRPVDQLLSILASTSQGGLKLQDFINRFSAPEVCAMSLSVLVKYPLTLLKLFPDLDIFSSTSSTPIDKALQDKIIATLVEIGGHPSYSGVGQFSTITSAVGQASFNKWLNSSNLFMGAIVLVSHILTPVWTTKIIHIKDNSSVGKPPSVEMAIPLKTLTFLIGALKNILDVMKQQPTFIKLTPKAVAPTSTNLDLTSSEFTKAHQEETSNFGQLKNMLDLTYQCAQFFRILNEHGIDSLIPELSNKTVDRLRNVSFEYLLGSPNRSEIVNELVSAVASKSTKSNPSSLTDDLCKFCLDFCNNDILLLVKGNEHIKQAKATFLPLERTELLKQSLRDFESLHFPVPPAQLKTIIETYCNLGFQSGALTLISFNVARAVNFANQSQQPTPGYTKPLIPIDFKTIDSLYELVKTPLESYLPLLKQYSGNVAPPDVSAILVSLTQILSSTNDSRFHATVCAWLIYHDLEYILLDFDIPSVESYLASSINQATNLNELFRAATILYQYYTKRRNSVAAAQVYFNLASNQRFPTPIKRRADLLSTALERAQYLDTIETSIDRLAFIHSLEQALQTALIQQNLVEEIHQFGTVSSTFVQILPQLDSKLFTINELWDLFAAPENLYASKLILLEFKALQTPDSALYDQIIDTWKMLLGLNEDQNNADPNSKRDLVDRRIDFIIQRIRKDSPCFPPEKIVELVVKKAVTDDTKFNADWAIDTLLKCQLNFERIYISLLSILDRKDAKWVTPKSFTTLLSAFLALITAPDVISSQGPSPNLSALQLKVSHYVRSPNLCLNNYHNAAIILKQLDNELKRLCQA